MDGYKCRGEVVALSFRSIRVEMDLENGILWGIVCGEECRRVGREWKVLSVLFGFILSDGRDGAIVIQKD